jgi:transcription-repair coupling factor (superfamily II helicase)
VVAANWTIQELEPERIVSRAQELVETSAEFLEASWSNTTAGNSIPVDLGRGFFDYRELKKTFSSRCWISLSPLMAPTAKVPELETTPEFRGQIESAATQISNWWAQGFQVAIAMAAHGTAERLVTTLNEQGITARQVEEVTPTEKIVDVFIAHQEHGLIIKSANLVSNSLKTFLETQELDNAISINPIEIFFIILI